MSKANHTNSKPKADNTPKAPSINYLKLLQKEIPTLDVDRLKGG
ncbi:MAG: hypothetical protein AAFY36_04470 [Bacteroidota bacterium]